MDIPRRYFGIKELSKYTSIPEPTLYEWARNGIIPSIKVGKRVLFDLNDIDSHFNNLKRKNDQNQFLEKTLERL